MKVCSLQLAVCSKTTKESWQFMFHLFTANCLLTTSNFFNVEVSPVNEFGQQRQALGILQP